MDIYKEIVQAQKLKPNPGSPMVIFVDETGKQYHLESDAGSLTSDSVYVLETGAGGNTRWVTNSFFEIQEGNNPGTNEIATFVGAVGIGVWPGSAPGGGDYELDVAGRGHFTQSTISSDERFKEDIRLIAGALDTVLSWNGVLFKWNAEYAESGRGKTGIDFAGVIAQNILESGAEELVSEWSVRTKNELTGNVETICKRYGVDYDRMAAYFIEAIKELAARISELEKAS